MENNLQELLSEENYEIKKTDYGFTINNGNVYVGINVYDESTIDEKIYKAIKEMIDQRIAYMASGLAAKAKKIIGE